MKILIVCPYFFEPHRWMISAYKTALYLSKSFEVIVLTVGRPKFEQLNPNLKIYRMWDIFVPDPFNQSIIPGLLVSLALVIWREKPTHYIVNKHTFFTSLSILFLRLIGKKVVTTTDAFPGINWFPRGNKLSRLMVVILCWCYGMPLLWLSTRVVVFHNGLVPIAKRYGLRYTVIPNGVDLASIDAIKPNKELQNKQYITVIYVGRLESIKGYDDIIAVARTLTEKERWLRFVFVGSYAGKEAMIQREATKQIMFLGHRSDVISLMKAADIFVLSSYSEGLPNALMEAMATSLSCVATKVGGVPYLLRNGHSGRLFTPGDRKHLASIIEELCHNRAERKKFGRAARAVIERKHDWSTIARQYVLLLERIN